MDSNEREYKLKELQNQLKESVNSNIDQFQGKQGEILLLEAAKHNDTEFANKILAVPNSTVDVNVTDENGNAPLKYAIFNQNEELIKLLLFHGAKLNQDIELFLERNKKNNFIPVFYKMYRDLNGGKIIRKYKSKSKKHTKKHNYRRRTNKSMRKHRHTRRY
jgi:ankyrin repeat protein